MYKLPLGYSVQWRQFKFYCSSVFHFLLNILEKLVVKTRKYGLWITLNIPDIVSLKKIEMLNIFKVHFRIWKSDQNDSLRAF